MGEGYSKWFVCAPWVGSKYGWLSSSAQCTSSGKVSYFPTEKGKPEYSAEVMQMEMSFVQISCMPLYFHPFWQKLQTEHVLTDCWCLYSSWNDRCLNRLGRWQLCEVPVGVCVCVCMWTSGVSSPSSETATGPTAHFLFFIFSEFKLS